MVVSDHTRVVNNVVNSVSGGDGVGVSPYYSLPAVDGGNATGLWIDAISAEIHNNTIYQTTPGQGVPPDSVDGHATGLHASSSDRLIIMNNSIVDHENGLSAISSGFLASNHNNLWLNETNYVTVLPGICSNSHFKISQARVSPTQDLLA
jgi:hypothetical protein